MYRHLKTMSCSSLKYELFKEYKYKYITDNLFKEVQCTHFVCKNNEFHGLISMLLVHQSLVSKNMYMTVFLFQYLYIVEIQHINPFYYIDLHITH
jgi:hypothetical protein